MENIKYYINNDWFKIGRFGEKHVRYINTGLLSNIIYLFNLLSYRIYLCILYFILYYHLLFNKLPLLG